MRGLEGKSALVIGGASGLGHAIVDRLVAEKVRVVAADRDAEALAALAGAAAFQTAVLDVTDAEAVADVVARIAARAGSLDVVVNSAGVGPARGALHVSSEEDWRRVLDVNLTGAFHVMRAAIGQMLRQETRGVVVNIASTGGLVGMAGLPSYAAAKGGLVNLTRAAAIEYGPAGIRVNAVAPSAVVTPLFQRMAEMPGDPAAVAERISGMNPLAIPILPQDVAAAVAFLSSEDARTISGVVLPVDGGYTAQ